MVLRVSFGTKNKQIQTKGKSIDIFESNGKSLNKRSSTHSNLNKLNGNKNNIEVQKMNVQFKH